MEAAGTASERVEALKLAIAAWVGAEIGMVAGLSGMAAALMGTTEAVTMG